MIASLKRTFLQTGRQVPGHGGTHRLFGSAASVAANPTLQVIVVVKPLAC